MYNENCIRTCVKYIKKISTAHRHESFVNPFNFSTGLFVIGKSLVLIAVFTYAIDFSLFRSRHNYFCRRIRNIGDRKSANNKNSTRFFFFFHLNLRANSTNYFQTTTTSKRHEKKYKNFFESKSEHFAYSNILLSHFK